MRSVKELFSLDKKVAVVTGGAGKYGLGFTEALAEAGALVVIAEYDKELCRAKTAELVARGLKVEEGYVDIADEKSVIALRQSLLAKHGRVDILVNNAVGRVGGKLSGREVWEQSMRVNAVGLYICCSAFLETMVAQRAGNIINISSMYGVVAQYPQMYPGTGLTSDSIGDYFFHKAGMINYTRYLATHFAEFNVRANCITPGGLLANQPAEFLKQYNARVPLGRMANVEDIKGAVVYLASEASAYVTGSNLVVDGGWTAW